MTLAFFLAMTLPAFAAEPDTGKLTAAVPAEPQAIKQAPVPAPIETEVGRQWKALQAQRQWITRLKKQLQGELQRLTGLQKTLAQNYKLDPKKLEDNHYEFDEKTQKFVETNQSP